MPFSILGKNFDLTKISHIIFCEEGLVSRQSFNETQSGLVLAEASYTVLTFCYLSSFFNYCPMWHVKLSLWKFRSSSTFSTI